MHEGICTSEGNAFGGRERQAAAAQGRGAGRLAAAGRIHVAAARAVRQPPADRSTDRRVDWGKRSGRFWQDYYASYIAEDDIRYIKSCGLNSVRLPVSARHLLQGHDGDRRLDEAGAAHIDRLLSWCAAYGLYAVLDMHAAPGGQTGTNIDDSESRRPVLFEDAGHADDTVWLWRQLAARYAENPWVAGYDLLNEPLPKWFAQYNDRVLPLYRRITEAIRSVDPHHLIILEGVHWATDWRIFAPLRENRLDNCMLEFHKYWNSPDTESLRDYLKAREQMGYPVYMGEGGENNLPWYAGVFHLLEQHDIGWNFWAYKKLNAHNSFVLGKNA